MTQRLLEIDAVLEGIARSRRLVSTTARKDREFGRQFVGQPAGQFVFSRSARMSISPLGRMRLRMWAAPTNGACGEQSDRHGRLNVMADRSLRFVGRGSTACSDPAYAEIRTKRSRVNSRDIGRAGDHDNLLFGIHRFVEHVVVVADLPDRQARRDANGPSLSTPVFGSVRSAMTGQGPRADRPLRSGARATAHRPRHQG